MKSKIFPSLIANKYVFVKTISFHKAKYNFALYKDRVGKLYFAKAWDRSMGKVKKAQLTNEIQFYKLYSNKINAKLGTKYGFRIPKYFEEFASPNSLVLLIEYVGGKQLRSSSKNLKLKKLISLIDYQVEFSQSKVVSGTRVLSHFYFSAIVPVLATFAFLKNIKRYKEIINCVLEFYLSSFNTKFKTGLINRDINTGNLLISKHSTHLIDFQLINYGPIAHQFSNLLYSIWFTDDKIVFDKVFNHLTNNKKVDANQIVAFLAYAYIFGLSFGTDRNIKKSQALFKLFIKI